MNQNVYCIHCKGRHDVAGDVVTIEGGRRQLRWTCSRTGKNGATFLKGTGGGAPTRAPTRAPKPTKAPTVAVNGGPGNDRIEVHMATPKPARSGGSSASSDYTRTLSFKRTPNLDFDPRSVAPFIVAVVDGLRANGIGGMSPESAVSRARAMLAEAMGEAPAKRSRVDDAGDDFAVALGEVLIALGITPAEWVAMYPAAAAKALSQPGALATVRSGGAPGAGGLASLPDVNELLREPSTAAPTAVVGAQPLDDDSPAFDAVERLSTGFAAGTVGASRGPVGAAAGAAAGFFAPELASAGEWVVNQLGLFGGSGGRANAAPGTSPIGRTSNPDAYRVVGGTPINP